MIPELDDNGYLPAGIHPATLEEIEARFGRGSEIRQTQMESLRWLVDLAKRTGVRRLVVNGSFATAIDEPNDVDCVLLLDLDFPADATAVSELRDGLPFLQLLLVGSEEFDWYVASFFASDQDFTPKGLLEVKL